MFIILFLDEGYKSYEGPMADRLTVKVGKAGPEKN